MRHALRALAVVGCTIAMVAPVVAGAALTEDDFYIKNAQDLVDLCSAPESDPLEDVATHFCHGFASGAWQYHEAQANGPKGVRLVCPPDPPPTRNEVIAGFVTWAGNHPQHMSEPAVEALFRYLVERAPCSKGDAK
jgi:hypothetical protein